MHRPAAYAFALCFEGAEYTNAYSNVPSPTQPTLRPIHSVGFYITDKFAALWAVHSLNFRSPRGVSHGIHGTLEQPADVLHLHSMTSTLSLGEGVAAQVVGGPVFKSTRSKTQIRKR
jgi:hypothetical protein